MEVGLNGRRNARVTSSFRLLFVNTLKLKGLSPDDIREEIGHKKRKTTEYYLQQLETWE